MTGSPWLQVRILLRHQNVKQIFRLLLNRRLRLFLFLNFSGDSGIDITWPTIFFFFWSGGGLHVVSFVDRMTILYGYFKIFAGSYL